VLVCSLLFSFTRLSSVADYVGEKGCTVPMMT
jgi:hypothetical protein